MPAKSLPYFGEFVQSFDFPTPLRVSRIVAGYGSAGNDVALSNTGAYNLLSVPAGAVVLRVFTRVITAFNASVTLDIGDEDTAAGFLGSATIAPQTAVSTGVLKDSGGAGGAYAGGRHYLSAKNIRVTVGGAAVTAGQIEVFVVYAMAGKEQPAS